MNMPAEELPSIATDVVNDSSVDEGPDIDLNVNGGDPEPDEEEG